MSKFNELKRLIAEELELSAVTRERKNKSFKLIDEIRIEQEELQKKADKYDDLSKPIEVDKFISDWYKLHENDLEFGIWKYIYDYNDQDKETKFYRWFNNTDNKPIETLIRMKDGYTVKQEQLYHVDFMSGDIHKRLIRDPENGVFDIVEWSRNLIGTVDEIFTESEIKAIDERYMAFAVKVEEEQG